MPPTTTTTRGLGSNLIHAYLLTSNRTYLTQAQSELNFIISGWDTNTTDGCPGGVFWEDVAGSQRNTAANGAGAELALELDRLTGNTSDLTWATRTYQWTVTCLRTASGLYNDHVNPNGSVNTAIWSYNQGVMLGAGVLLYQVTRERHVPEPSAADGRRSRVLLRHRNGSRQPGDGVQRHLFP